MKNEDPFIWHELVTAEPERSGAFFAQLFGWTCKEVEAGEFGVYTLFQKGGRDVAGMMRPTPDTPFDGSYWHSYVAVDDIEESVGRAAALGGRVVVPPQDVPDVGRVAIVADPTGALTHLMQPITPEEDA